LVLGKKPVEDIHGMPISLESWPKPV
jgi:hypothetical protein